ncbi:hypothetical protein L596_008986 [Steinernema carpocapsae]|uniref:Coenzyme PQQ synthesis protein F-like C-terminal lobe domain-containing protein n=1 Tax=Steinernema carpocapsae TaxID=34508 RepID=A0A4U5PE39_STECR|nr:hypothetical protein L596_008986 [Steinernema carpocapsae]
MMSGVLNVIKKKIPTCRPLLENEISKKRHLKLEDSKIQWVPQSCALIFLQIDSKSVINRANLRLLYQLIISPTHTVLRGQEQLGYVAQASLYDANEPRGLYVLVGGAYDPKNVQGRIESFLEAFGKKCRRKSSKPTFSRKFTASKLMSSVYLKKTVPSGSILRNSYSKTFSRKRASQVASTAGALRKNRTPKIILFTKVGES